MCKEQQRPSGGGGSILWAGEGSLGSVLHAERHQGDLLVLLVAGRRWQGDSGGAAALGGPGTAGEGTGTAGEGTGTAMPQRPGGLQDHRGLLVVLGALLHSPPGLPAALGLRAGRARAVLLQRPAVDFDGRGAHGGHRAHLHPPPGLAALRGRAGPAAPGRALAGALSVLAEAAGVLADLGGVLAVSGGAGPCPALVAAARGGLAQVVVAAAFLVEHPGAEMAEPRSY